MSSISTLKLVRVPQGVFVQQIDTKTDIVYFVNTSQEPVLRVTQDSKVYHITDLTANPEGNLIGRFEVRGDFPEKHWWFVAEDGEYELNTQSDFLIDGEVAFFKAYFGKVD